MNDRDNTIDYFWEAIRKGQTSHFYLFYGEKRRHRGQALSLAAALNCQSHDDDDYQLFCKECPACRKILSHCHPDVEIIAPAKSSIGIDQVVTLQRKVSRKPYEGACKVYIIEDAEKLTLPAANALLVTAEEPPDHTVLVLSCSSDAAVLPTLRSRARAVYFPPDDGFLHNEDMSEGQEADWADALRLCGDNAGLAREVVRVGVSRIRDLMSLYKGAVKARNFLRIFALFPMEREVALVLLQVIAAKAVGSLYGREETQHSSSEDTVWILPLLEEALRALQRQADVRLTIEVLALKHMKGL
jgi:DNA polymerase-3 subunit delta'